LNPLVLRPACSITAFQHHVTRSLRRFHVRSPVLFNSSLLDHSPWISILCLFFCWFSVLWFFALESFSTPYSSSSVGSVLFGSSPLDLSPMFCVLSSAGLLLFESSTLDRSLRSVFLFSSLWFFALLARSLCFNTI